MTFLRPQMLTKSMVTKLADWLLMQLGLQDLTAMILTLGIGESLHLLLQLLCREGAELFQPHEGHVVKAPLLAQLLDRVVVFSRQEDDPPDLLGVYRVGRDQHGLEPGPGLHLHQGGGRRRQAEKYLRSYND